MKLENTTDEALIDLLKKGSKSAFEVIYARYSKSLLSFIYRMVNGNEALAQDILHDVFLKLIENPKAFDSYKRFKPWLYTVAANASRKSFRNSDTVEIQDTHTEAGGKNLQPNLTDQKAFDNLLNVSLNKLSTDQREAFILKHQQHLSIKEIAAITQVAEGTVKSRLHTATRQLAQSLKQYNPKATT